jgi:hypothetical protein
VAGLDHRAAEYHRAAHEPHGTRRERRRRITLDERGARWLATVAIHEGWRLTTGGGAVPMGAMRAGAAEEGELPEPPATAPSAPATLASTCG